MAKVSNDKTKISVNNQTSSSDTGTNINSPKSRLATWAIIIVVLIAGFGDILYVKNRANNLPPNGQNAAFVINGTAYSKDQIEKLITYPISVGDSQAMAVKKAYNMYQSQAAAQKLKMYIPQSSVAAEKVNLLSTLEYNPGSSSALPWIDLVANYDVIQTELGTGSDSLPAEGSVYNFWFNQHEDYFSAASVTAGRGNATLIQQDRLYALSRANYYDSQLKQAKINGPSLIQAIDTDPKLNNDYLLNANNSKQFKATLSSTWQSEVDNPSIVSYIDRQTKTGIGPVEIGENPVPKSVSSSGETDAFYFIVQLSQLPSPQISQNQFKAAVASLNSTYNGL